MPERNYPIEIDHQYVPPALDFLDQTDHTNGHQNNNSTIEIGLFDPKERRPKRILRSETMDPKNNHDKSRKTPAQREERGKLLRLKTSAYTPTLQITETDGNNPDFSLLEYEPADPELPTNYGENGTTPIKFNRNVSWLDPDTQVLSAIRGATIDPDIADIFIEAQTLGNHNGSKPTQLETLQPTPLHTSPTEDSYDPESQP